jgi:threonine dehydrogenase-like Zn-dependent dehydrogenase
MMMPKAMKAVRVYGPNDYRFEEISVPCIGPEEVLVKVLATGVCASDVKTYQGARVWGSKEIDPYIVVPVTPGHEFIGKVVALGDGAGEKYDLAIGDHCISEQIVPCWQCRFCRSGKYWMCQRHDIYGFIRERAEGSWAEYMRFPAGAINHIVPREIPVEHAVLIEPLACAIHAVQRGNIELSDVVVVAGMGPIGLCMLQIAKQKGPAKLIALDMKPKRLELAKKLGADLVINVQHRDAVVEVLEMTNGYGCDVYIEATGAGPAVKQGLQMLRRLGTFVEFSVHSGPVSVDWSVIGDVKELNIHGSHLGPYCYPLAIEYLRKGAINGSDLVTHILPLQRFEEGLQIAAAGDESVKVVFE